MRRVGIWERILRGCFSCATVSIDQRGLWKASARCCVGRLATAVLAVCPLASRWHCRCQEADQGTRFSLDWLSWEWCAMSTWHNSGSQQPRKTLPQSFFGGGSPWGACSAVPSTASKGVALALPITSAHSFICFIYVCAVEIKAQLEGGSPLYRVGLVFKLRSPSLVARAFTYLAILRASSVNSSVPACMHACILSCVVVVVCVCVWRW